MNGTRDEFLAGPALALNQNGGIRRRDFADKLKDFANLRSAANDIVLDADFGAQRQVFLTKLLPVIEVFQSQGGDLSDGLKDAQMVAVKLHGGNFCVEINHASDTLADNHGNANKRGH